MRSAATTPQRAGGFFTITNTGTTPDRLVAAASPLAERVEIHAIKVVGADIEMRPLNDGLVVHPGSTLELKPRGYHLLLIGLKVAPARGTRVPVTLTFEKAGTIEVSLAVSTPGPVGAEILDEAVHRG